MINDSVHTDETDRTDMSPQAEFKREREFSGIIRELKEIGPQADEEGRQRTEQRVENIKYFLDVIPSRDGRRCNQQEQLKTTFCPQADFEGERECPRIIREFKKNNYAPWMICEPNEKEGKKLLAVIMHGGNFGQYDTRDAALKRGGMVKHGVWKLKRVMRLVSSYPEEALWEPVFRVWHMGWRGING